MTIRFGFLEFFALALMASALTVGALTLPWSLHLMTTAIDKNTAACELGP